MADVNANIRIDIDTAGAYGELRRLQSQISNFNNSLSTANASAAAQATALNKALKDGINASGMFEARMVPAISSVERFSTALEKNKLSLGEYTRYAASQLPGLGRVFRKEWDTMEQVATSRVKKLNAQYLALGKSAKGAQEALQIVPTGLAKGYATDLAIATQRQQIFNKLIDDGSTKLLNWGKNTQWAGRQLMVGFSLPLAALGAAAAKTFMELDKASTAFERVYGDLSTTTAEMERNKDAVMALGSEYTKYGIAVKDTLELSARVAATGLQNEDMLAATEQTLRFATLGQMEYNEALDATISLQSAFNVSSQDLGSTIDYLNAVENQTVLTIQDMAAAIPRVAPVIQGLGGDVKDLAVMMTAMREGGVTAENAANALKSGLASLINPTQRAQESMAKLGIDMQAIIDTNRGDLLGTVTAFGQALSKVDEFSQQQALEQIFGKYQYARMGALFSNIADGASQASRAMDLAGMSVSELAQLSEKELGSIAESTTVQFEAAMERLKLSIAPLGEAFLKGVMPIMDFLTSVANAFNNLPDPIKNAAAVITGVVAGLGPVFLMTIGLIGNGIANLVKGIQFFRRTVGRIKGDAANFGYLADAELEAKVASEQLESSVTSLTTNLNLQRRALGSLITQYGRYAQAAGVTAAALPNRRPAVKMARGGVVPGTGSGDKVPALLEPGETVVTKKASQKYGPVIAAMNAGNLPGYQDGLNIPNVSIPENAVFRKGSEQSISKFFESISHMSGAANAATRVLQNLSDQGGKITAKAFKQAMIEEGIVPSLPSGRAAAHLTKRGDISETGMDWLESKTGRGEGGKSVTAQNILALAKDPEMAGFVKEYSGLTADLSQTLNTQLQTGAAVADFNREWSETGSRLLPSLQTFGDFVVDGADDLEALNTFERELGKNINARSDVMETGMVTDDILEEETRKLINQYKDTQTSMGKVARAADTASKTIGQVSIAMSEAEAEDLVTRGMATRSETDKETRYLSSSGAVLGRKSKDSGTWRPERYGRLARAGASITQTAARSARDAIRSASPSEEFAEIMEDAAEGALVGAKRSASVSRKAGQVVGQSAKEAYKAEMSQLRRDVRNVEVMEKGGMKDATMQTRTLRRLRESEARAEQAKLVEAKRSQQLAERAARDARVRNIAETAVNNARQSEIRELTRMQKLSGKLGGVGRGIAGRAGTVGMGLGMASMIPFMAQNEQGQFMGMDANALGMGMGAAGMAFDMVGLAKFAGAGGILGKIAAGFAAIAGPLAIATAAIGAVGIGMYLWRKNVDESSRQAAEFGANVGGASNALNKMAEMLGRQTPAQRAAQVRLGVTAEQSDQMAQWAATFEDGAGKQFIDELKAATSEERFSKLSDYLKYAIAAGMMDAAQAETFANAVAVQLGDSILGMRAKTAIAGQETGTKAMLALAANRAAAVKGTEGYQQVGIVRGNATDEFSTTEATNADQVIGGSMQVIQDYANAAALAAEELAAGKISQAEYQSAIQQSNDAISRATFDMTEAMYASDDLGGSMQALKDQLAKAGVSAENAEYISGINQQVVAGGPGRVKVVGATTEQLRSEAAAAAMQGMDVENIKAITEYMQGEDGGAVSETFKRIASNKESQGQAYGLAAFQMSLEQGALGDQIDQGAVMEVAINYVEEGGTAAELQQFLMTLPPEVVTKVITDFEGMTPEEQKKYIDSYNQLLPSLGAQSAYDVTQASGGKVDPETAAASAQLKQIFGSDQETITRYVNIALNTEPRDISKTLPEITKNMEDINKNIPQDIQKLIGIDLKNPQDVEKYGPLSEDINALVPAINALPEGQKEFAVSIMMKQNGKEVKDPIKFAKDMVKYQKTLAGLSSDKLSVRKESAVQLITTISDQNGNPISPDQAKNMISKITNELGITEKEFLQLPPDTISKVFQLQVAVAVAKEDVAAAQAAYDAMIAMGVSPTDPRALAAAAVVSAANAALKTSRKNAKTMDDEVAAGMIEGGNDLPSGSDSGGGGDKGNPWKDFLSGILTQVQTFSDINAKMSDLFKGKTDLVSLLKKNQGLDDQIRKMGLSPRLAEMLRGMDPKEAKVVLARIKSVGKRKVENQVLANAVNETKDALTTRTQNASAQRRASMSLAGRGVKGDVIATVAGDPAASQQYLDLLKNAQVAHKKYEEASGKNRKALKKEWQEANAEVRKFLSLYSQANVAERAAAYEADKQAREYGVSRNLSVASELDARGIGGEAREALMGNEAAIGKVYDAQVKLASAEKSADEAGKVGKKKRIELTNAVKAAQEDLNRVIKEQIALSGQEQFAAFASKSVVDRMNDILNAQVNILSIKRQIEELQTIEPLRQEIEGLNEANEALARTIELKQRDIEKIDESISKLEEEKDQLNRMYDERLKALDAIEQANERIYEQQRGQLSIAQALSTGDVAGAAKAMQDLQIKMAQDRQQSTRDALELSRQRQLEQIDARINVLKDQRKAIENEIKDLQRQQRVNADAIYVKQQLINNKTKELNAKYDDSQQKLALLTNELASQEAALVRMIGYWTQLGGLMSAAGVPVAPTSSTTTANASAQTASPAGTPVVQNSNGTYTVYAMGTAMTFKSDGSGGWIPVATGGLMRKYSGGGGVLGDGARDSIPAMLTPGEFVMRKAAVDKFGSAMFQSLNMGAMPRFNVPTGSSYSIGKDGASAGGAVYNYDISVNVPNTNASPDEIANVVLSKIKMQDDKRIRSNRY